MAFTQSALLLLLLFWTLQIAGSWIQWRSYRRSMAEATGRWKDGFLGVGRSKSMFRAGAVVLLTVAPDLRVRQLAAMKGITVFARFRPDASAEGCALDELERRYGPGVAPDTPLAKAVRQAIDQVRRVVAAPASVPAPAPLAAATPG